MTIQYPFIRVILTQRSTDNLYPALSKKTIPIRAIIMSELQNEEVESEVIEPTEIEDQEDSGSDLAPDNEAEHEEKPQAEEEDAKQAAINKAINKKHFEAQQAKRELETANARIKEFEDKQRELEAARLENIPPLPDAFDDDYDQRMQEREQALIAQAQYRAQQAVLTQQQRAVQEQAQAKQAAEFNEKVQSYTKRALDLGIKQSELQAAGNVVGNLGLSDDLVKYIIADKDGPLIVKHLAANQLEGVELAQMSPYEVGAKLSQIKAAAAGLKPKTSKAPNPSAYIGGNGVDKDSGRYQHIKGAKFE